MARQPQTEVQFTGRAVVFAFARNSSEVVNSPLCHRSGAEDFHVFFALANALQPVWNRKVRKRSRIFSTGISDTFYEDLCVTVQRLN